MKPTSVTTIRRSAFAIGALVFAVLASQLLITLKRDREALGLNPFTDTRHVSPGIEFATKSLGCFRAMAIITLWMRATDLQDQGKFFELNDLFRMISQLEPRFPMIWAYWAWNVSYNCSVKFPASQPEERWRWVKLGIEILRDRGIEVNPRAPALYRELAWIYSHKIGQDSDEAHYYYKAMLAVDMQDALGKPPYLDRLKAIAAAPKKETELLADPAVRALVDALRAANADPFLRPLDVANRSPNLPPAAIGLMDAPDHSPARGALAEAAARLEAYLRAVHLREDLRLEPDRMVKLMDFGPIDWRLPEAHALYWSARSVELFGGDAFAAANADRVMFHSLVSLYRRGRLRFEPPAGDQPATWIAAPNFAFLDRIVKLHEEIAERNKNTDWAEPTREGYYNFLRDAVLNLFVHNDQKTANVYLKKLITAGGEPQMTLEQFVFRRFHDVLQGITFEQASSLISGFCYRSLFWSSVGDLDQGKGQERLARLLYKKYADEHTSKLFKLPPLRELWLAALREAIRSFRPFQIEELRRLYTNDVNAVEEELKKREAERQRSPAPPAPTPTPRAPTAPRP